MPTKNVEAFIREHINTQDNNLQKVLRQLLDFIALSEDGFDMSEIQKTFCYIGELPLTKPSFLNFGASKMWDRLRQFNFEVDKVHDAQLVQKMKSEDLFKAGVLSEEAQDVLFTIALKLFEDYRSPGWIQTYKRDEQTKQIMTPGIAQWQKGISMPSNDPNKSYLDFTREFTILGESIDVPKTATIVESVALVLNDVTKFVNKTNYKEDDKKKLTPWLMMNGGQDVHRFVDFHFNEGIVHVLINAKGEQDSKMANVEALKQDWAIENGKIVFNLDEIASAVVCVTPTMRKSGALYATANGEVKWANDVSEAKAEKDSWQGRKHQPALMRVKAKVELAINDKGDVEPRITMLRIASYTDKLEYKVSPALTNEKSPSPRKN